MSIDIIFLKCIYKNTSFCTNTISTIRDTDILSYITAFNQNYIITKNKNLYVHGLNVNGQLGIGNIKKFINKFKINSFFDKNIIHVAIGMRHCIFMTNEIINNIYSSGCNMYGQLGKNCMPCAHIPQQIKLNKKIVKIACGIEHTLLLTDENTNNLYAFGNNFNYQLGIAVQKQFHTPINIKTKSKILNIDCCQHASIYLDFHNNVYIFGTYKKNIYKNPVLINIDKFIVMCNINYSNLFILTSEIINNLYAWNTNRLIQNIISDKFIVTMTKQNETIICADDENNYYYYGNEPLFISNKLSNIVYNTPIINIIDVNNVISKINFGSSYIIYNTAKNSLNNSIYINVMDDILDDTFNDVIHENSHSKIIFFTPSGTIFSDYVDLTVCPILQSNNYELYYYSHDDIVPQKLEITDNNYGAYYQLNEYNNYKIFTKHFSKLCLVLKPVVNIKHIPTQYYYTNIYNILNITINTNYSEDFIIVVTKIINIHNKKIMNIKSLINGTTLIFNSSREFYGLVQVKITSINNPNIYNVEFCVNFHNKIKVKKKYHIYKNDIFKLDINSCLCNFNYNKKKIKLKYKNNSITIYAKKKSTTHICIFTGLYKKKIKIVVE